MLNKGNNELADINNRDGFTRSELRFEHLKAELIRWKRNAMKGREFALKIIINISSSHFIAYMRLLVIHEKAKDTRSQRWTHIHKKKQKDECHFAPGLGAREARGAFPVPLVPKNLFHQKQTQVQD